MWHLNNLGHNESFWLVSCYGSLVVMPHLANSVYITNLMNINNEMFLHT